MSLSYIILFFLLPIAYIILGHQLIHMIPLKYESCYHIQKCNIDWTLNLELIILGIYRPFCLHKHMIFSGLRMRRKIFCDMRDINIIQEVFLLKSVM